MHSHVIESGVRGKASCSISTAYQPPALDVSTWSTFDLSVPSEGASERSHVSRNVQYVSIPGT